jgi:hypothetical protein
VERKREKRGLPQGSTKKVGIGWRNELKQPALRIPIQRHLGLPTTYRVQIQMAWLTAFKDRPDDVRRSGARLSCGFLALFLGRRGWIEWRGGVQRKSALCEPKRTSRKVFASGLA